MVTGFFQSLRAGGAPEISLATQGWVKEAQTPKCVSPKDSSRPSGTFLETDQTCYEAESSPLAKGSPPQCLLS